MLEQVLRTLKIGGIISSDIIVLAVVFFAILVYTMYFGKNRTISAILSYYPAVILFTNFPFTKQLMISKGGIATTLNSLVIFLIIFIPLNIIINRYIIAESGQGTTHIIRTAGLAFTALILVIMFSYTIVDLSEFYNFSHVIDSLFATPNTIFIANLIPLALLAFF